MGMDEEAAEISRGGGAFVLTWFTSLFYGDSATASTTNRVLEEMMIFYVLVAIGFLGLYLMWRSHERIKKLRKKVARMVREQNGRQFEPSDAAKLYGMF